MTAMIWRVSETWNSTIIILSLTARHRRLRCRQNISMTSMKKFPPDSSIRRRSTLQWSTFALTAISDLWDLVDVSDLQSGRTWSLRSESFRIRIFIFRDARHRFPSETLHSGWHGRRRHQRLGTRIHPAWCRDQPGNSGGPSLNLRGEIISINTLEICFHWDCHMGFSIPSPSSSALLEYLEKGEVLTASRSRRHQHNREGSFGWTRSPIPGPDWVTYGIYVIEVVPGSKAAQGGLDQETSSFPPIPGELKKTLDLRSELTKWSPVPGSRKLKFEVFAWRQDHRDWDNILSLRTKTAFGWSFWNAFFVIKMSSIIYLLSNFCLFPRFCFQNSTKSGTRKKRYNMIGFRCFKKTKYCFFWIIYQWNAWKVKKIKGK